MNCRFCGCLFIKNHPARKCLESWGRNGGVSPLIQKWFPNSRANELTQNVMEWGEEQTQTRKMAH